MYTKSITNIRNLDETGYCGVNNTYSIMCYEKEKN